LPPRPRVRPGARAEVEARAAAGALLGGRPLGRGGLRDGDVGADAVDGLQHARLRILDTGGDRVDDDDECDREGHADCDDDRLLAAIEELAPQICPEHRLPYLWVGMNESPGK